MAKLKENGLYRQIQRRLVACLLSEGEDTNRVLEIVSPQDFDEPVLELIFTAIVSVARRNETVSIVSVAHQLESEGNLQTAGGDSELYLLRSEGEDYLVEAGPDLYARILKEQAAKNMVLRVVDERRDNFKPNSGINASDAISELQTELNAQLYSLSDEATTSALHEDFESYLELVRERQRIAEANRDSAEGLQGIPSLLPSINHYTTGWLPGQLITIGARTGVGKALAVDTPIRTIRGWKTMGEVQVGDYIFGRDGKTTKIINATEVQYDRKCYRVKFHNGESIIADADHRWLTKTHGERRKGEVEQVRTTEELSKNVRVHGDQRKNHSILSTKALEFDEIELPLDPYILGYWLKDGHSWENSIAVHGPDAKNLIAVLDEIGYYHTVNDSEDTYNVRFSTAPISRGGNTTAPHGGAKAILRELNLLQNKHIPTIYLRGSIAQRRALLAGLLDSNGSYSRKNGQVEFEVTNQQLAFDVQELAVSLGLMTFMTSKSVRGAKFDSGYNLRFKSSWNPFRLLRKAKLWQASIISNEIFIDSVTPVSSVPVRCIQVDNEDHVFLAGRSMIPTHNSVFAVNSAVAAAQAGKSVLFFSLEMSDSEIKDRIVSSTTGVLLSRLRQGEVTEEDQNKLSQAAPMITEMKIKIETEAKVTVDTIRAKALRQAQAEEGLDFVILDYLQLVTAVGKYSSRQEAVADLSRNMKLLAKQLEVPIMVLVQVNREDKNDENPLPKLHQIRESGAIAQDSDVVILLHREETMDDTIPHTLVLLEKNRSGEAQKTIRCHSNLECSLFREVVRSQQIERMSSEEQEEAIDDMDFDALSNLSTDEDDFFLDEGDGF